MPIDDDTPRRMMDPPSEASKESELTGSEIARMTRLGRFRDDQQPRRILSRRDSESWLR